ncbi:MAG: NFACT RNA binding domain-containing protein, partial [Campylobacteraceae bacterium]
KQTKNIKKENENDSFVSFFIDGFKVMVGKNEKGNIELLKASKKNDIWLHVKDIPSAHVIIKTDKTNLPEFVIEFGAKLCVNLSKLNAGSYLVDYTPRRNVKPNDGANVTYVNYKTISVQKEN